MLSETILERAETKNSLSSTSIDCISPLGFTVSTCNVGHKKPASLRCHSCVNCERYRVWKLTEDLIRRLMLFCNKKNIGSHDLQLWTFGTSLVDTIENRIKIRKSFALWRRKWQIFLRKKKSKMLWYCVEAGSKGGRLHIHTIAHTYSDHEKAREIWKSVVEDDEPNVHFAPARTAKNSSVERIARYLAKYLSKTSGGIRKNYYLLGELIKFKTDLVPAICGMKFFASKSYCQEYILYWIVETYQEKTVQHPAMVRLFSGNNPEMLIPVIREKKPPAYFPYCRICETSDVRKSMTYWNSLHVHTTCLNVLTNHIISNIRIS